MISCLNCVNFIVSYSIPIEKRLSRAALFLTSKYSAISARFASSVNELWSTVSASDFSFCNTAFGWNFELCFRFNDFSYCLDDSGEYRAIFLERITVCYWTMPTQIDDVLMYARDTYESVNPYSVFRCCLSTNNNIQPCDAVIHSCKAVASSGTLFNKDSSSSSSSSSTFAVGSWSGFASGFGSNAYENKK